MISVNFHLVEKNLFISDSNAASNISFLKTHNITHILICGTELKARFKDYITYQKFDIQDSPKFNIHRYFDQCIKFIETGIMGGGNVLVHCKQGRSRSVTVVIAYLISRGELSFIEAFGHVKRLHPISCPNDGFLKQLSEFERQVKIKNVNPKCDCNIF